MKAPVEIVYDCMGDGTQINLYANRYRGNQLLGSKFLATLTVAEADALVKALSAEIHRHTRLVAQFGGAA